MLLGEYEHTIDDKNRLTLPAKFRGDFARGIVVTRGLDGCLFAYTGDAWERLVASTLAEVDQLSQEGRRLYRHFFSGASESELDRPGRGMFPAPPPGHPEPGRGGGAAGGE